MIVRSWGDLRRVDEMECEVKKQIFEVMSDFEGMEEVGGGIQSMEMGGNITMPLKKVRCCQSEVGNENNSRGFQRLVDDTTIQNTITSYL